MAISCRCAAVAGWMKQLHPVPLPRRVAAQLGCGWCLAVAGCMQQLAPVPPIPTPGRVANPEKHTHPLSPIPTPGRVANPEKHTHPLALIPTPGRIAGKPGCGWYSATYWYSREICCARAAGIWWPGEGQRLDYCWRLRRRSTPSVPVIASASQSPLSSALW